MTTHIKKFLATYDAHLRQNMNDVQHELNRLEEGLLKELDEWLATQSDNFRLITIIPRREASFDVNDENWVSLVVVYQAATVRGDWQAMCERMDVRDEAIECCAQVVKQWIDEVGAGQHGRDLNTLLAAIRALKDKS